MSSTKAYIADRIFTGEAWLKDHGVIVDKEKITDIVPLSGLKKDIPIEHLPGYFLAPAFLDLQIYGAYGKLLAAYPEANSLFKLNEYCNKGGAAFCLPTAATNTYDVFYKCIDAIKDYWSRGGTGVLGLHIEGPWINPVKRGAHIESLIHSPTIKQAEDLLNYGKGVIKIITLAPEVCSREVIDLILSHDVIISAGHSNATYKQAIHGFDSGITAITHLYNAMSPLQHRAPGLVGAGFDHNTVMASIIPDGHHVDFTAVRIAKQIMKERLFVITDAVTETNTGYYPHHLEEDKYEASGILSGSALTMNIAVKNLVEHAGIDLGEALRMCSLYPARVIKLDRTFGKIKQGYATSMVVMSDQMEVKKIISE